MPQGQNRPQNRPELSGEEYRRYQEEKAKRRQKKRMQKILLLAAFAVGAILLVVCIVMIVKGLFKPKAPVSSVPQSTSQVDSIANAGGPIAKDPNAWNLQVISPAHPAEATLAVPELATLAYGGVGYYIDARVAEPLQQMIADCNNATGGSLRIISAYRAYPYSEKQYNYYLNSYKKQGLSDGDAAAKAAELEMPPGTNDHQTALSVDFVTNVVKEPATGFDQTPEYQWLRENGANYGFVLRFQADKTEITGVAYRPYQFRYVGVEDAAIMREKNLSLEEYVGKAPGDEKPAAASKAASNAGSTAGSQSVAA